MKNVLVIGGGLAGCTVVRELSKVSIQSTLLEKDDRLGGKVRTYGCKAGSTCNNCGVCISGNLWTQVEEDPSISKYLCTSLIDLYKDGPVFTATVERNGVVENIYASDVVVATGFEDISPVTRGTSEIKNSKRIHTGYDLETLLSNRSSTGLFKSKPKSVGFIMCYGSRDVNEKTDYCSRVCCSYGTKSAKVVRHYYPDADITMFYMDLQSVASTPCYSDELEELGIHLERCKPAKIELNGEFPVVTYEGAGGLAQKQFDELILCTGIKPGENVAISNITGLGVDSYGFLEYVSPPESSGVYIAGCVSGPKSIEDTAEDARAVTTSIINKLFKDGSI